MKHKNIPARDRLIFAMDVPTCDRARELSTELGDAVSFYKIGLELMMSGEYFELLDWLLARDKKVFCDLKFFDIPATVGSAVRSLKDRMCSNSLVFEFIRKIRPVDNRPVGDQKRVVTVETAFRNGCDYIVVGRPIRDAESPRAAAEIMQSQIAEQVD